MFTPASGITVSSQSFKSFGNVAMLEIYISHTSAWTVGTQVNIGAVDTGYKPAVNAGGIIGTIGVTLLATNGNIYVRPLFSESLGAGGSLYVRFTYLLD